MAKFYVVGRLFQSQVHDPCRIPKRPRAKPSFDGAFSWRAPRISPTAIINTINCLEQALTAPMQVRCRRKYTFPWPGICVDMGDMRGGGSNSLDALSEGLQA